MKTNSLYRRFKNYFIEIIYNGKYFSQKICNRFTPKNAKSILFYPHINCKYDDYDVFNYKSDNVLCLVNNVLNDNTFDGWTFWIVYYNEEKISEYLKYAEQFSKNQVIFIYYEDEKSIRHAFYQTLKIFTDEMYRNYPYKCSGQQVVCLNYYPFPFKSDYSKLIGTDGKCSYCKEQTRINKSYDRLVSISDLSSIMITQAEPFFYEKCITLGYPRSDVFYCDNSALRERLISSIGQDIKRILVYVPTHRDYENKDRASFDKELSEKRTIWGYESQESIDRLNQLLDDSKAIIIAKIHPIQARNILSENTSSRILLYHDIIKKMPISLNELMAVADGMITDYTSAVFDFLNIGKPIIYYFYDVEKYVGTRGFVINPMTPLIAGDIAKNLRELVKYIEDLINGVDNYREKRDFISDLMLTYRDNLSTKRVKDYFLKTI